MNELNCAKCDKCKKIYHEDELIQSESGKFDFMCKDCLEDLIAGQYTPSDLF